MPTKQTLAPRAPTLFTPEDLQYVFHRMGGAEGLVKFARATPANQRLFWTTLFPLLLAPFAAGNDETGKAMAAFAATWLAPGEAKRHG
jgi:hypothetical protein